MKTILASMFLVIGGIGAFIYYSDLRSREDLLAEHDKMYYEIFQRYPDVIASSSRGDALDTLGLDKVMKNYNEEKYSEALADFDAFLNEHPEIYQVKFYRGITQLQLNNPEKAIADLKAVMSLNQELSEQAEWYLALAYLKQNKVEEAKTVMQSIVSKNNSESEKAKSALDKLGS